MVILSDNHVKRTPAIRLLRAAIGAAAVALIIWGVTIAPYDIMRAERFRIYGETRTFGIVTAVRTEAGTREGARFFIDYKYVDSDGLARHHSARLPHDLWLRYRPGSRVEVLFTRQRPDLARVPHEIEPPFQLWLRRMLD